ncbi:dihydrosphingosine 1-phosphate phosphatase [Entomortierella parvispora]|uniref:Dihydrosphingosine 1-phosphate phosphatase n=1 Tax=Entomortierella parvispora TaxID=205924 RepID=A0A9P3H0N4_9FUNG|nr:dihydrosphingosine 1-phosphate phosphatase [Entomortierella parvispora]
MVAGTQNEKPPLLDEDFDIEIPAGIAPEAYYDSQLSPLRAAIRRFLLPYIRSETPILHRMQLKVRHPILDVYFSTTAFSGNHTFFMIALPVLFWFGFSEIARGFTLIAAMGVYWAGFFKDYLCLPRPLSPPIVRLSRSKSTCQEYGFPSSHSTNAVSVALFLYCHLLTTDPASWSPYTRELSIFGLIVYAVSIVYGRLYCGMHSITDCVGGSMIGLTIWATQWTFRQTIEYYMVSPVWWVPPLVVATGIFLVSIIPDPIDDCPCFDDCVAFIAVLMGLIPASIHFASTSYSSNYPVPATIPYSTDLGIIKSVLRLVFGVGTLFVWRLAAKKALYVLLPPVYKLFSLPYRPHFIPASTYNTLSTYPIGKVPSVIDLPSMTGNVEIVGLQSAMDVHEKFSLAAAAQALEQEGGLRARKAGAGVVSAHQEINMDEKRDESSQHGRDASVLSNGSTECGEDSGSDIEKKAYCNGNGHHHSYHSKENTKIEDEAEALLRVERMHPPKNRFDVDIVSKLVVYAGIGALAVDGIPILFEIVGLGAPVIRI